MKVLICDDEPLARDRLRRMLERVEQVEVVGEAHNGVDLLGCVSGIQPDVVITDIRMPGMDGIEAAEHIAGMAQPPAIIFCTAYDEYALKAFQVQAVGYLLKPVNRDDLSKALVQAGRVNKAQLSAVKESMNQPLDEPEGDDALDVGRTHISARTHQGLKLIPVNEIRYFMADHKYITVRGPEDTVLIDQPLRELEEEFGSRFIRVHRNALVALAHIERLEQHQGHYQLSFQGIDDRISISRRHVAEVKKLLPGY